MKRLLLLALCAFFAADAGARTLYVDAKRPNNKGNGLSAKKAKKTIQAAINIAKKGDTILVCPGTYAPITTNNKKITIKSIKGKGKTTFSPNDNAALVADLSKHVKKHYSDGIYSYDYTDYTGNATIVSGFTLDGKNRYPEESRYYPNGDGSTVLGGTVRNCTAKRCWVTSDLFRNSRVENCLVQNNYLVTGSLFRKCTVRSTKVANNKDDGDSVFNCMIDYGSTLVNCLVVRNSSDTDAFSNSTLVNCTVADNAMTHSYADSQFSWESKFYNCVLWNNRSQRTWTDWSGGNGEGVVRTEPVRIHNVDPGNVYKNTDKTNKNPKFANAAKGNYKLKKGSYCINKGKLTKAQKKLVGTKDLAGKKRIKGKAIDRGCYEY